MQSAIRMQVNVLSTSSDVCVFEIKLTNALDTPQYNRTIESKLMFNGN